MSVSLLCQALHHDYCITWPTSVNLVWKEYAEMHYLSKSIAVCHQRTQLGCTQYTDSVMECHSQTFGKNIMCSA